MPIENIISINQTIDKLNQCAADKKYASFNRHPFTANISNMMTNDNRHRLCDIVWEQNKLLNEYEIEWLTLVVNLYFQLITWINIVNSSRTSNTGKNRAKLMNAHHFRFFCSEEEEKKNAKKENWTWTRFHMRAILEMTVWSRSISVHVHSRRCAQKNEDVHTFTWHTHSVFRTQFACSECY